MKKNISDLLDAYGDPNIDLERSTPLSSERIKALTMSKIKEQTAPKKRRTTFRVLVVAAVIVTLAASAFAAGGEADWFQGFFEARSETELSAEQLAYIEQNAVDVDQSDTVNGYTMTVQSYISDGNLSYLKMKLQVPADAEPFGDYFMEQGPVLFRNGEPVENHSGRGRILSKDEDQKTITFLLILDADLGLEDGDWVQMKFSNLYQRRRTEADELVAEGTWNFVMQSTDVQEIELITDPVECVVHTTDGYEAVTLSLTSVRLRSMSMEIEYDCPGENVWDYFIFDNVKVIMSDGSTMNMNHDTHYMSEDGENTYEEDSFYVDAPLNLDEVAYIEFPGGTKIPVNMEE